MPLITPQRLNEIWDCIGQVERQAFGMIAEFAFNPPYVCPEEIVKPVFQFGYGGAWEKYYKVWFDASKLKIVTRTFQGVPATGIDCQTGAAVIVRNCQLTVGCGDADPCDCEQWFWRNKPLPCA